MMMRIAALLSVCASLAACGEGGGGVARTDGRAQSDTAAGFRLGMLLPEARAAAAARGDGLRCELATTDLDPANYPDSLWCAMNQTELCDPDDGSYDYNLQFEQGSRVIILSMGDDWDFIPVDMLVGRLSKEYGEPRRRVTYPTGAGRAEELIWWTRKGPPAGMGLRCPDGATAGACTLEFRLFPPEERAAEGR